MEDRFSRYGIIACIILRFMDNVCDISDWCMSCRVLKKGVELFTIKKIVQMALQHGCDKIIGHYARTEKNDMVSCIFEQLGFDQIKSSGDTKDYELELMDIEQTEWENAIEEVYDE